MEVVIYTEGLNDPTVAIGPFGMRNYFNIPLFVIGIGKGRPSSFVGLMKDKSVTLKEWFV